jgi:two-component system sensor histidine kinase HydH
MGKPDVETSPVPSQPKAAFSPVGIATILAVLYVVFSGVYILLSGRVAAEISRSVPELARLELFKGLTFILVTGGAYFAIVLALLRRMAFQEMKLLQHQSALIRSEGRALAGIFAASVAHDIRNVIGMIRGHLDQAMGTAAKPDEPLADIAKGLSELNGLSNRLMMLGKPKDLEEIVAIDLPAVVRNVVKFGPTHIKIRTCKLSVSLDEPAVVMGNESLVDRMLMNLILNAAESTGGRGRVEVRVTQDANQVHLEVHDDGPGVPRELRGAIFDAFYTTKSDGTGLGLLSVKLCAEEHHGTVSVGDSDLGGACFRVSLPKRSGQRQAVV